MKTQKNNRNKREREKNEVVKGKEYSCAGSRMPLVVPLNDLTRADVNRVGVKAANLGEMLRAGFPVPNGFVLTTEAFDRFLSTNALDTGSSQKEVALAPLPPDIETLLRTAAAPFDEISLAVRSSGVAEDLSGASFAGQYETVLDVRGFNALALAVRRCWASAFSDRVAAYITAKGMKRKGGMAILVQRLVHADAAGVAFSANPVTGNREECVVNAVRGLGERLVSGQSTPDEWVVHGQKAVCHSAPEGAITEAQALDVAELAQRAATHFGEPQDVEWAIADDELFMLQARPITALPEPLPKPVPVPIEPPPGFWERESVHFSEPLSPMMRSAILPLHESGMYQSFQENSMLLDGVQFREIGGWLYQRIAPLGDKERVPPPVGLTPLLVRLVPDIRQRIKGLVNVIRSDKLWHDTERWYTEWKPNTINRINQFRIIELPSLSDARLEQHLEQVLAFIGENLRIHALITAADFLIAEFVLTCQELLGWDEVKSLELLSGLSTRTTEPTHRLNELANMARNHPAVRNLLNHIDHETKDRLAVVDDEFADAFNRYLQEYGYRTLRFDLNEKTLEEKPELVLSLIRNQIARNYDFKAVAAALAQKRASNLEEAMQTLSNRSPVDNKKFRHALTRAERAYPIREEHEFYLNNVPLALFRYALLEIGSRLTNIGMLERKSDIFFLELDEARVAFREGIDQRATVIRRKGELAWVRVHPGPASYGKTPPPPPSMEAFPPEVKHMMRVFSWMINSLGLTQSNPQTQMATTEALQGLAASHGQYTGPVRIIMNEAEFSKLKPGDVLVCPTTQPPWSVLFPIVGALVTDSGGILSHPAIIAREYGVPAVLATGNATSILRDDQIVTVDGNSGHIMIEHT